MAKRIDQGKVAHAEKCIALGMLDAQIVRELQKQFGVAEATGYRYLNLAYQSFAETNAPNKARQIGSIRAMLAADRARALAAGDRREAGKCVDRLMRLHGVDRIAVEHSGPDGEPLPEAQYNLALVEIAIDNLDKVPLPQLEAEIAKRKAGE